MLNFLMTVSFQLFYDGYAVWRPVEPGSGFIVHRPASLVTHRQVRGRAGIKDIPCQSEIVGSPAQKNQYDYI